MKQLFTAAPQDYVTWLMEGAIFQRIVSPELQGETLHADMLLEVLLEGETTLLHVEFQRRHDPKMAKRLWNYNNRATEQYDCPVWSVVIYLKKENVSTESPYQVALKTGRRIHDFDFDVIKLWEIPTQQLKAQDLPGLLPLLPLTSEGAQRDVVDEAIAEVVASGKKSQLDLLTMIYNLASLAFENDEDQNWLIGRFNMLYEILRETPIYQEMTRRSHEEGLEEGIGKGIDIGKVEEARKSLLLVGQTRFPALSAVVSELAAQLHDVDLINEFMVKLCSLQDAYEVEVLLLEELKKRK